ncbi:hypothetical protein D3C87_1913120 [compost metagenome]
MVSALAVLGFVIDNGILHFNFTSAKVTLEVGHIIIGIPQTEFGKREQLNCLFRGASVLNNKAVYFSIMAHWYKSQLIYGNPVAFAGNGSVA